MERILRKNNKIKLNKNKMSIHKIKESIHIIKKALEKAGNIPIIVNYSGGKDSLLLLDLVRNVTENFLCFYCVSGIEFPQTVEFVKESAKEEDLPLMFSYPKDHKGGFFKRLSEFNRFPTTRATWCSRDLKWRTQKKVLTREFGSHSFYKLNAVRKYESNRRNAMYKSKDFFKEDQDVSKDIMVRPLLNWTTRERDNYLRKNEIKINTNPLYEKFGVSGCYYCPFYERKIYWKIIQTFPNLYDNIIKWEERLNSPACNGFVWLRDIKKDLVCTKTLDKFISQEEKLKEVN